MMPLALALLAVVYLLIVARLWSIGRVSDQEATVAAISWAPGFTLAYGLLTGTSPVVMAIPVFALLTVGLLLYRSILSVIQGIEK